MGHVGLHHSETVVQLRRENTFEGRQGPIDTKVPVSGPSSGGSIFLKDRGIDARLDLSASS